MPCIDLETSELWERETKMPCSDGGPTWQEVDASRNAAKLAELEEMLCSACRMLESEVIDFDMNPPLSKWWAKHKKEDEKRIAREIKERNEFIFAKGMAESLTVAEVNKLDKTRKDLLKKHGFI